MPVVRWGGHAHNLTNTRPALPAGHKVEGRAGVAREPRAVQRRYRRGECSVRHDLGWLWCNVRPFCSHQAKRRVSCGPPPGLQIKESTEGRRAGRLYVTDGSRMAYEDYDYPRNAPGVALALKARAACDPLPVHPIVGPCKCRTMHTTAGHRGNHTVLL